MKIVVLTGILILNVNILYCQHRESTDTLANDLEEIVFSANRWEQNLLEVPMKIHKINSTLVRFQNPQTAADLLGISNQVYIQKSQLGGGSPIIRGFATNRVLIVVDGIRMNNAIFRSGNVQNVISLDPNAVAATEVIFGPGAVMYGSDAIGGVMDFHTLTPLYGNDDKLRFSGNAMTRFSSANKEKTGHVDFNIGLKKWSFVTSVTRSVYDDLKMGSYGPEEYLRPDYVVRTNSSDMVVNNDNPELQVNTGYDQWNAMQKVAFRPNVNTEITYGFHYSATSNYPRYDRLILIEEGLHANAEWYYGPQKWMMQNLNLTTEKGTSLYDRTRLTIGYQQFEESRHNRGFGSSRRTDRTEKVFAFSTNLDLEKKLNDEVDLFYGAEFVTNEVKSVASRIDINTGEVTPTSTRYPDGADWRSVAVYSNMKFMPSEQWTLNASARYTSVFTRAQFDNTFFDFQFSESEITNGALSGSVGAAFNPDNTLKIYTNLSTGFRAPNVDDIGKVFDSEPGNVVVPNPTLKPEMAYSGEVGFTKSAEHVRIDFSWYYTLLDNAISRGPSKFNGYDSIDFEGTRSRVLSLQNISELWVTGIQASVEINFNPFKLSTAINIQNGREKDPETGRDVPPTHVVPAFGSTHLIYQRNNFMTDLYSNYNGSVSFHDMPLSERADNHLYAKDKDGNPYAPAWWTLNLKAAYRFGKHLSLSGGVENILDKRYRPYSSGIAAPGRNFIISVRAYI